MPQLLSKYASPESQNSVQVEIYSEVNLATWLRLIKSTELNISDFFYCNHINFRFSEFDYLRK